MMQHLHTEIFKHLEQSLHEDPRKGFINSIQQLKQFPTHRDLYVRAMVLSAHFHSTSNVEDQQIYISQLQQILAEAGERENTETEEQLEQQKAAAEKKKFFLEQGVSRNLVFECQRISKGYKGSEFRLRDTSLLMRQGEITGVVGENANGKTTLLKIIAGELKQDEGNVYFNFDDERERINWQLIKSKLAYLPQELPRMYGTMVQNLRITASVNNIQGRQNDLEVDYIIQRLGLAEHQHKVWDKLSGGYKLRFSLARLLIRKPQLIVMDEPLASLDINTTNIVLSDLRALADSISHPVSIIFSSQHIEEIEAISDKILLLSKGRTIYYGATANIGNERVENTFEFKTHLSRKALEKRLCDLNYKNLTYTGISYLINTSLNITLHHLMEFLITNNIEVHSVSDISKSTRKYLLTNHEPLNNEYIERAG